MSSVGRARASCSGPEDGRLWASATHASHTTGLKRRWHYLYRRQRRRFAKPCLSIALASADEQGSATWAGLLDRLPGAVRVLADPVQPTPSQIGPIGHSARTRDGFILHQWPRRSAARRALFTVFAVRSAVDRPPCERAIPRANVDRLQATASYARRLSRQVKSTVSPLQPRPATSGR